MMEVCRVININYYRTGVRTSRVNFEKIFIALPNTCKTSAGFDFVGDTFVGLGFGVKNHLSFCNKGDNGVGDG